MSFYLWSLNSLSLAQLVHHSPLSITPWATYQNLTYIVSTGISHGDKRYTTHRYECCLTGIMIMASISRLAFMSLNSWFVPTTP